MFVRLVDPEVDHLDIKVDSDQGLSIKKSLFLDVRPRP